MFNLLAWLFLQAARVYAWFGAQYPGAINVINNVWAWVVARVAMYYELAKAWATTKKAEAIAVAYALKDIAVGWANALYTNARAYALAIVETAKTVAYGWIEAAKTVAYGWIETAKTVAYGWIETAKTLAYGWVETAKTLIITWAAPVVSLFPWLSNFIPWITPTKQAKIDSLTGSEYPTLAIFMQNPVGTIMAILKPYFVTLFCYAMAYALGTEEATLPPWPVWGGGGEATSEEK